MLKTEIKKILADKSEVLDDGRMVVVPDYSNLSDLVEELSTLFSITAINQRRKLLGDEHKCKFYVNNDWTGYKPCECGKTTEKGYEK